MPDAVLALDAGTTSVRALVIDGAGSVLGKAAAPFTLRYPAPGLVEQDGADFWATSLRVMQEACAAAGLEPGGIGAIGVTSQRSCTLVWDRKTHAPLTPIVGWQDLRGAERAAALQQEGYLVLPFSSGCKLEAVLDLVDDGRGRMARGELAWGNVDSYAVWRLSGGAAHVTDPSQACASGYYDYLTDGWLAPLLELQGLDAGFFPTLCDTAGALAVTSRDVWGAEVPIGAIVGDQQSAAYAQVCRAPGEGKVTYGTSATCNVNTGTNVMGASGTYPLVLWRRDGVLTFCIEGMVVTAGATFDWLANGLGILESPSAAAEVAASVPDSHGVYVLPALQGLGTPHADTARHAVIGGLTRGATAAHVVRAAVEGVAFRVREMIDRVYVDLDMAPPDALRVDGGAAANDVLLQCQADVLGRPVERMAPLEATAFGAGVLAGEACGMWDAAASAASRRVDRVFEPQWSADERDSRFATWRGLCQLPES